MLLSSCKTHAHLIVGYPPPHSLAASSPSARPLSTQTASQRYTQTRRGLRLAGVCGCECGYFPLRGSLDSAGCAALSRYLALSCNTTTTCWFLTKPLLLLSLTTPPVISCSLPQNFVFLSITCSHPPSLFSFPVHFFSPAFSTYRFCLLSLANIVILSLTFIHLHHFLTFHWCEETWRWVEVVDFQAFRSAYRSFFFFNFISHRVDVSILCPWRQGLQLRMLQV